MRITLAKKKYGSLTLTGVIAAMVVLAGCGGPSEGDGVVITEVPLPTDTVLSLPCADAGIAFESCILDDPENPFRTTPTNEFNENDENPPESKFTLASRIPAGPTGAKARFYFWATALARRGSGENQFLTAVSLHELLDAQIAESTDPNYEGDPIVREQALRAYQSVLDNFFGSVIFFIFAYVVDGTVIFSETGEPPGFDPDRGDRPLPVSVTLNELTADFVYREAASEYPLLVPGPEVLRQNLIAEWGYTYRPCVERFDTEANATVCENGLVFLSEF